MSLIHCGECEVEISDKACACPYCSCPSCPKYNAACHDAPDEDSKAVVAAENKFDIFTAILVVVLLSIGIGVGWLLGNQGKGSHSTSSARMSETSQHEVTDNAGPFGQTHSGTTPVDTPQGNALEGSLAYEDKNIKIWFKECGKDPLGRDTIVFEVENRTSTELTLQSSSLKLNGRDMGYIAGTNAVAPQSRGTVWFFPDEPFPADPVTTLAGSVKVIGFSQTLLKSSYDVSVFLTIRNQLEPALEETSKPSPTNLYASKQGRKFVSYPD